MTINDTYLELHFFQFTSGPSLACSVMGFWVQGGIGVTRLQESVGTRHVPEVSGAVLQSSLVHGFSTGAESGHVVLSPSVWASAWLWLSPSPG